MYHVKLTFPTGGICFIMLVAHLVATRGIAAKNNLFQRTRPRSKSHELKVATGSIMASVSEAKEPFLLVRKCHFWSFLTSLNFLISWIHPKCSRRGFRKRYLKHLGWPLVAACSPAVQLFISSPVMLSCWTWTKVKTEFVSQRWFWHLSTFYWLLWWCSTLVTGPDDPTGTSNTPVCPWLQVTFDICYFHTVAR